MKIALLGYGKMGKLVRELAEQKGHEIIVCNRNLSTNNQAKDADVAIDFSHAEAVPLHVDLCIQHKIPLVIGTTGWHNQYNSIKQKIEKSEIGCLYAPNFSIGIALFKQVVAHAASLLLHHNYDLSGIEYHHREKVDAPSGTAKALTEQIIDSYPHLKDFCFSSVRCGHIPGTHTLLFDGPIDTITLTHQSRNRTGYADGAITAAGWIKDKKGFFNLDDLMKEICA